MVNSYWLPIRNHTLRIQWSNDRWRHVTRKAKLVTPVPLKLNISKTVRSGWIATKLAHDGPQYSAHPRSAQGQGQGKRSRDTHTSVISRNVCYTVPSDVLSLHALTLWSTISFYYKRQAARCNVYIMEWGTSSFPMCQIAVNMVYKLKFCTFTIHNIIRTFIMVKPGNCLWQLQFSSCLSNAMYSTGQNIKLL